jgi:hypothetical protein
MQTAELFMRVLPKVSRGPKRRRGQADCGVVTDSDGDGESLRSDRGCGLQPRKRRTKRRAADPSPLLTEIVQKWDPFCGNGIGRLMRSVLQARSDAAEHAFALCVTRRVEQGWNCGGLGPAMSSFRLSGGGESVCTDGEKSWGDSFITKMDGSYFGQPCVDYGNVHGAELANPEWGHQCSRKLSHICVDSFLESPLCEAWEGEANAGSIGRIGDEDAKGSGIPIYTGIECALINDGAWGDSEWVGRFFAPEYMM